MEGGREWREPPNIPLIEWTRTLRLFASIWESLVPRLASPPRYTLKRSKILSENTTLQIPAHYVTKRTTSEWVAFRGLVWRNLYPQLSGNIIRNPLNPFNQRILLACLLFVYLLYLAYQHLSFDWHVCLSVLYAISCHYLFPHLT